MYSGAENKSYFNENDGTKDCTPNNQFNQLWHCAQVKKIRKRIENKEGSGRLIIGIASFYINGYQIQSCSCTHYMLWESKSVYKKSYRALTASLFHLSCTNIHQVSKCSHVQ